MKPALQRAIPLEVHECRALLHSKPIGRVLVSSHALPLALPVSYVVDQDEIVFAAPAGTALDVLQPEHVVGFSVDDVAPDGSIRATATAVGHAAVICDRERVTRLRLVGPVWWQRESTFRLLEQHPQIYVGYRFA